VRANHHRRGCRVAAGACGNDVADGIDRNLHAEIAHPRDHEIATLAIDVSQRQPGTAALTIWPVNGADLTQRFESLPQTLAIDAQGNLLYVQTSALRQIAGAGG
jgi:hypothetical protein